MSWKEAQETKDRITSVMLVCVRSADRFGRLTATPNSQVLPGVSE